MGLLSVVFELLCCQSCKKMLKLFEENRYGLVCELKLKCCNSKCYWEHVFYNTKKNTRAYQINRRAFYSIRKIGGGYQSLRKFLCLMNHPPPMTEKNYRKTTKVFCDKIKGVAETHRKLLLSCMVQPHQIKLVMLVSQLMEPGKNVASHQ